MFGNKKNKAMKKYFSKGSVSKMLNGFNSEPDDITDELWKKAEVKTYEISVFYTKELDVQKWLERLIPKLIENNYIIDSFFGNFLFAFRACENGFDEATIKNLIEDNTKIAVFIKDTEIINVGTEKRFKFGPVISFGEDFLKVFSDLEYGKYMVMKDN